MMIMNAGASARTAVAEAAINFGGGIAGSSVAALALARRIYTLRQYRGRKLGDNLFGDPAWDILLDLLISSAEGRRLSVSASCIGSRAAAATALRYLGLLEKAGLVQRDQDAFDARRTYIGLTSNGRAAMIELLASDFHSG